MADGIRMVLEKLKNGEALEKFRDMLIAQGVNEAIANELCYKRNYDQVFKTKAEYSTLIKVHKTGFIKSIHALELGLIASKLGAGRAKAGDQISYEVGFRLIKKVGDKVDFGNF